MINDQEFFNSSYCNINLIDQEVYPHTIRMIYQQYLWEKEKKGSKTSLFHRIQTTIHKGTTKVSRDLYLRTLYENENKQTFGKNQQEFEHPLKELLNPRAYYKPNPQANDSRIQSFFVSNVDEAEIPEQSINGIGNDETASQRNPFLQRVTNYKDLFHQLQDNMQRQGYANRNLAQNTQSLFSAITSDKVTKTSVPLSQGMEPLLKDPKNQTIPSQAHKEKLPALTPKRKPLGKSQFSEKPPLQKKLALTQPRANSRISQRAKLSPLNRSLNEAKPKESPRGGNDHRERSINRSLGEAKLNRLNNPSPIQSLSNQSANSYIEPRNSYSRRDLPVHTSLTRVQLQSTKRLKPPNFRKIAPKTVNPVSNLLTNFNIVTIGEVKNGMYRTLAEQLGNEFAENEDSTTNLQYLSIPETMHEASASTLGEKKDQQPSYRIVTRPARSKSNGRGVNISFGPDVSLMDDSAYSEACKRLSDILAEFPQNNKPDEALLKVFVNELRTYNPIFAKLSQFGSIEIFKMFNILVLKNESVYQQNDRTENSYLVLYGRIYLMSKELGVFKECIIGDTLAEEAILDYEHVRLETAKAVEETALLEISPVAFDKLKYSLINTGYRPDILLIASLLKRNHVQKKSIRTVGLYQ